MTENLNQFGLKSIVHKYDLYFIDIWGVVHNGVELHYNAVNVLDKLKEMKKDFILLTNAPRPNQTVISQLKNMGLKNYYDKVFTSGQAALKFLIKDFHNQKFYHIGAKKDFDLFKNFENLKVELIDNADYILCTGLFENNQSDLNYYKKLLKNNVQKKMICTNPDLVVDRGNKREYCAGSIAKIFEEISGRVVYFGKPFPPVYKISAKLENKKVLCIGDNFNTDIRGANMQNFDSLLISGGIHRNEILNSNLEELLKDYNVKLEYIQTELKW